MAVDKLNDKYARNATALAGTIYSTTINRSVWNKLVVKEEWVDGIADVQKALTIERNLPDNVDEWQPVAPNQNTNTCATPADVIPRGSTERSFELEAKAVESDPICVHDGRNAYQVQEQTRRVFENMRNAIAYIWKRKAQIEYTNIAANKVVAAPGLPYSDSHMPTVAPTSVLTQKMLNQWYLYLIQNSAELDGGALGMAEGKPQLVLVTDMETADDLMREDSTNVAILYNASKVPALLSPLGVERAFRGFYYTIDTLPRRFTLSGGVWTEVMPYETAAATIGTKQVLSPAYMAAPFTDSYIYLPSVMHFLHPKPITTFGSGTRFDAQTYVGDFKWMNVIDVDPESPKYNPDGEWGFYRAKLMTAVKPVHPEFGVVIRHLRCPGDIGAQACPENTSGSALLGSDESFFV